MLIFNTIFTTKKRTMKNLVDKKRNSSIELLRVIAMLFIVMSHSSVHGQFLTNQSVIPINNIVLESLVLGNLGVLIFWLITGYFLCDKINVTKSAAKLHAQVLFYSIVGLSISFMDNRTISLKDCIVSFFPVLMDSYWFFTVYIIFLFFIPYVNIIINNSTRKQHLYCFSVMIFLWGLWPTLTGINLYGSKLLEFLMFYLIGAYFKKYPYNLLSKPCVRYSLTIISFLILLSSNSLIRLLGQYLPIIGKYTTHFYELDSILIWGCAIGLFSLSIYKKAFHNMFINLIGGSVFGVYLIHENIFIRPMIWGKWFPNYIYYDSSSLIVHVLISIIVVYVCCIIIELFRQAFFDKVFYSLYMYITQKMVLLVKTHNHLRYME